MLSTCKSVGGGVSMIIGTGLCVLLFALLLSNTAPV